MSIKPEGRPTGDAPFTVAVRIKNSSGQELARRPYVSLSTEAALEAAEEDRPDSAAVDIERIDENVGDDHDVAFKRGEAMVARFRVTPRRPGLGKLTLLASAFESDDEPGPTTAAAMDARSFTLTEATPAVAAK
jgi:hypothetical protein